MQSIILETQCPVNRAETQVKASDEWHEYIETMVAARKEANLAKVNLEYIRMKYMSAQSSDASQRAEMRLTQ